MKTDKMRRSKNIMDFRGNKRAQDAYSLGNQVQAALDNAFVKLGGAEVDGRPEARKRASDLRKEIDSLGTQGKGRAGSGSRRVEKILRAYERKKWNY